MFWFGVVLSELEVHTLPYAQSNEQNRDSNGTRLPDALILQKIAMGKLCVDFSESNPQSIIELGMACVCGSASASNGSGGALQTSGCA